MAVGAILVGCERKAGGPPLPLDIPLRDGRVTRVYSVAYGTNITIGHETLWQKLTSYIPAKIRPPGWGSTLRLALPQPSLVFAYGNAPVRTTARPAAMLLSVVDEQGYGTQSSYFTIGSTVGSNLISPEVLGVFPRRSKNLTFRMYSYDNGLLGEVTLPNPHRVVSAPWVSQSLPQRRELTEVSVKLTDVVSGADFGSMQIPSFRRRTPVWTVQRGPSDDSELVTDWKMNGMPSENTCTLLTFEFESKRNVDRLLHVTSVISEDASGNKLRAKRIQGRWREGKYYLWVYECLWPEEPIKYRLEWKNYFSVTNGDTEFVVQPRLLPVAANVSPNYLPFK
jgi:hypothetical protein